MSDEWSVQYYEIKFTKKLDIGILCYFIVHAC